MHAGSAFGNESIVTSSEICVTSMDGEVHSDMGMPLVAKVKGVDGVCVCVCVRACHFDLPPSTFAYTLYFNLLMFVMVGGRCAGCSLILGVLVAH
jgi:hypothetical protein